MKKILIMLYLCFSPLQAFDVPAQIKQLLVVTVNHANQSKALLCAYERSSNKGNATWEAVFSDIPVILGRHGIGLGLGLKPMHNNQNLSLKIEGDGKSPAGLFKLSSIFGYAQNNPNSKMPYIHLTTEVHCVDDIQSPYYNQIITKRLGYKSFEQMRRKDGLYKWGIVVDHNSEHIKGRGSCIFIHIMNDKQTPTSGCTAMSQSNLLKIVTWLDKKKQPALLQYLSP